MKRDNPTEAELKLTHPFVYKSKGKRQLCKKCGHTIRHWKHRLFRYPEGSVERMMQDDSTRIRVAISERLTKPSPFATLLGSKLTPKKKQLDMLTSPLTDKCPKCGFELVRYIREGSGEVFGCGACKTEWTRIGLHNAMLESLAGTKSNDPGMTRHEVTATGAIRSTAYPKGAKFPARYDLMMRNAAGMRRLAETWGEGFAKYGADNWFKGFSESQLISHIVEHIRLYLAGDKTEDHAAHGAWNFLVLCWIEENKPELLDLTKPEQKP